jgi:predicted dehydrogenase
VTSPVAPPRPGSPRVALIGANGHGQWHRRHLAPRHADGRLRWVAACDLEPVVEAEDAPLPPGTPVFADHREMLAAARPDVVIICTPPHTHLAIAGDAARAGCDVLLEKPPVRSLAEHDTLVELLARTGTACQVGFQALGSAALGRLADAIRSGRLGRVTGVSAAASWRRGDAYYARADWVGRRTLGGRPVVDGALANPLAHAVMQCLAVAEVATGSSHMSSVELERYRTRPIEVEDTACLRVRMADLPVVVAVTLCGEDFIAGDVLVHTEAGVAVLEYPTDRLTLPGDPAPVEIPGRVSLLDNLLAHRERREVALIAPLARTEPFTALLELVTSAPEPTMIDRFTVTGPERFHVIEGVNAAIDASARSLSLFSELDVGWARPPVSLPVPVRMGGVVG